MYALSNQSETPDVVSYGNRREERDEIDLRALRAFRLTEFLLAHRGRCFEGWPASKIFQYVHWHLLNGTLFVACHPESEIPFTRDVNPQSAIGNPQCVVIAWPDNALKIRALAAYGMPQFVWQELPRDGDSILIADVVGDRSLMPEILKQVMARWVSATPAMFQKRLFTYRRGKLVELSWDTVTRFAFRRGGAAAPPYRNSRYKARINPGDPGSLHNGSLIRQGKKNFYNKNTNRKDESHEPNSAELFPFRDHKQRVQHQNHQATKTKEK